MPIPDLPPELPSKAAMTLAGSTLITAPVWAQLLADINVAAASISVCCGAIVGVHTVFRLFRADRADRRRYRQWLKEHQES